MKLRTRILKLGGVEALRCIMYAMEAMGALSDESDHAKVSAFVSEVAWRQPWMLATALDLAETWMRRVAS